MRSTSRPRAATSVAIRMSREPFFRRSTIFSRSAWLISPLRAAAEKPRASSFQPVPRWQNGCARRSWRRTLRLPGYGSVRQRTDRSIHTFWVMVETVVVLARISTEIGFSDGVCDATDGWWHGRREQSRLALGCACCGSIRYHQQSPCAAFRRLHQVRFKVFQLETAAAQIIIPDGYQRQPEHHGAGHAAGTHILNAVDGRTWKLGIYLA